MLYSIKMLKKLLVEFIGTFVFLSVILTTGDAFAIGLALAVGIQPHQKNDSI